MPFNFILLSMLNAEELDKYKKVLDQAIEKTRANIEELEELTRPIAPENSIGRVSRMDAINNKSVNESALRKSRQKLIKMNHNLEALEKGGFGDCASCKQAIPVERLLFLPETNLCTPCSRRR